MAAGKSGTFCQECGKKIVGQPHKCGSKMVCGSCYVKYQDSLLKEESKKKELYDYLKKLFGVVDCPDAVINALARFFESGKKTEGMRFTIYYYYEIMGNPPDRINEVPWVIRDYYDEAKAYIESMKKLGEENQTVSIATEPEIVKIAKPTSRKRLVKKRLTED